MNGSLLGPIVLTAQLAGLTTLILMAVGAPIAWGLAQMKGPLRPVIEAIVALPLVLPPTVLGFYLLLAFNPQAPIGQAWMSLTGGTLSFSFAGLVIASCLYSLPFAVQPMLSAFSAIGDEPLEAAAMLGAGPLDRFISIVLPMSKRGLLTAAILSFAHTVGEFGIVLMVGGNIPGETRVISIAIFEAVETLDYASAHILSAGLLVSSFVVLLWVYWLNQRRPVRAI